MSKLLEAALGDDLFKGVDHDGETYSRPRDQVRLNSQMQDVFNAISDGQWTTLSILEHQTGHPQASISARLRDLRKSKFGSHQIDRVYAGAGQWEYRMML